MVIIGDLRREHPTGPAGPSAAEQLSFFLLGRLGKSGQGRRGSQTSECATLAQSGRYCRDRSYRSKFGPCRFHRDASLGKLLTTLVRLNARSGELVANADKIVFSDLGAGDACARQILGCRSSSASRIRSRRRPAMDSPAAVALASVTAAAVPASARTRRKSSRTVCRSWTKYGFPDSRASSSAAIFVDELSGSSSQTRDPAVTARARSARGSSRVFTWGTVRPGPVLAVVLAH